MNPREATWFEIVTDTFNDDLLRRPTLPPQTRFFHGFFPDTEASDLSDDAILFVEDYVRMCD